jgi:3-oxoacyl-[acyl-carrier protein] reductase
VISGEFGGRVALVTGGGTGFGSIVSRQLAAGGATVAIAYAHSTEDSHTTAAAIRQAGGTAATLRSELLDTATCSTLITDVIDRFGRLDILVNNAATTVRVPYMDLDALAEADWDRVMALNVKVPWLLTRAAANHLRASTHGVVVNVASTAAFEPAGSLVYSVSKAALVNLTKVLARVLAPDVRVNAVAPGLMHTRWTAHYSEEAFEAYRARSLLGRTVPLEDAAAVVSMLVANESITGQTVVVDAGVTVRPPDR